MLVLFDNGTPRTLARYLIDHHTVTEARARGWEELENGELLSKAEAAGFEVLVTTDKSQLPAKPCGTQDSHCRIGTGTMEPYQTVCGSGRRHRERGDTRQLCRGGNSLRVARSAYAKLNARGISGQQGDIHMTEVRKERMGKPDPCSFAPLATI